MSRQAVLLIHGIGEQRPMQTLRAFVKSVWTDDFDVHKDHAKASSLWSKPYNLSRNFELRKLSTAANKEGATTDFFELYWAHLLHDTKVVHLLSWARSLLWRRWSRVPHALRPIYAVLWTCIALSSLVLGVSAARITPQSEGPQHWPGWLLDLSDRWRSWMAALAALDWWLQVVVAAIVLLIAVPFILNLLGDAARYLRAEAPNIQARHEIRAAGVDTLKALHDKGYDRIIVVGHSLGTVIGYDVLTHAFADIAREEPTVSGPAMPILVEMEQFAWTRSSDVERFQALQRQLQDAQRKRGARWRVTDFITLGSPLAHAEVLMAEDAADLRQRIEDRELPSCPPTLEHTTWDGLPVAGFAWPPGDPRERQLHFAAPFALTRWTNLYFPAHGIVYGDMIGGPVAPVFGPGVHDVPVTTRRWWGFVSHNEYWRSDGEDAHLHALRGALDLLNLNGTARRAGAELVQDLDQASVPAA